MCWYSHKGLCTAVKNARKAMPVSSKAQPIHRAHICFWNHPPPPPPGRLSKWYQKSSDSLVLKSLRSYPKIIWSQRACLYWLDEFWIRHLGSSHVWHPNCVHIKGENIKAVEFLCLWLSSVMLGTLFLEELLLPSHSGLFWWLNKEKLLPSNRAHPNTHFSLMHPRSRTEFLQKQ